MTSGVSSAPDDLPEPRRQDESPSSIDLAENRVNTTESRFAAGLNRLLQQNLPMSDIGVRIHSGDWRINPRRYANVSLSSSAFASFRSRVSKPSVNQP
jgi:hypothetical protein